MDYIPSEGGSTPAVADSAPDFRCCKTCGETKPRSGFYVKNKKNGLLYVHCKPCVIKVRCDYAQKHPDRMWARKPENKAHVSAKNREYYEKNREQLMARGIAFYHQNQEKYKALKRQRYAENPEKAIKRSAEYNRTHPHIVNAWREANRDKINASVRKHRLKNPDSGRRAREARRARKAGVVCEKFPRNFEEKLLAEQRGLCPYCKADLMVTDWHRDHIIPLALGGPHTPLNSQLTCPPCNLRKRAKHPFVFGAQMGILRDPTTVSI